MAEFEEVGRIQVSPTVAVVISRTKKNGELTGYSLNKYLETDDYRGFVKGIFISISKYEEFMLHMTNAKPRTD